MRKNNPSLTIHSASDVASEQSLENEFIPTVPVTHIPMTPHKSQTDNPFSHLAISETSRVKQVWAIGGGKGGVGKSLVASSLAIALSRMGHQVIALDLDLGGANLHTSMGVGLPKKTLSDFLTGNASRLQDCVAPTSINNLEIISGAHDTVSSANMTLEQKTKLMSAFRELDADYLIFDLGAGSNRNTVDFFLYADLGLVVLLPEPTSIENAYRFIKSAYYRRLLVSPRLQEISHLIDQVVHATEDTPIRTPSDLYHETKRNHPETCIHLKSEIEKFQLELIINQARTQTDVDIGFSVKSVCRKYFGIHMDYVGCLDYDSAVWQANPKETIDYVRVSKFTARLQYGTNDELPP